MDQALFMLIPLIPVTVAGIWVFGHTAVGKALVHRIEGRRPVDDQDLDSIHEEVLQLREAIEMLRREQLETNERIDFTERMLSKGQSKH